MNNTTMQAKQYKLSNSNLPELHELKIAHRQLLDGYARSLAAVSRLSFFTSINEVQPSAEGRVRKFFRAVAQGRFSPLRLFAWQPMIKFYTETHIHRQLRELANIYVKTQYRAPYQPQKTGEYAAWLNKAKEDCDRLATTTTPGKFIYDTMKFLIIAIINFLIAAWGATNFSDWA